MSPLTLPSAACGGPRAGPGPPGADPGARLRPAPPLCSDGDPAAALLGRGTLRAHLPPSESPMPEYARRSRSSLLAVAAALAGAARRQRPEPLVQEAADAVDLARLELEAAVRGSRVARVDLSDAAQAALAAEASLDRRVSGLATALRGLAALGDGPAEAALDRLFPAGARAATVASGRAQVPEYQQLIDALDELAGDEALARLAPHPAALRADLAAFTEAVAGKDAVHDDTRTAVRSAADATAALRAALSQLDRVVEMHCGGVGTEGYQAWARAAVGLG